MTFLTTAPIPAIAFAIGHVLLMIFILNSSHGLLVNIRPVVFGLALAGPVGLGLILLVWSLPWPAWPLILKLFSLPCLFIALIGLPVTTVWRNLRQPPPHARLIRSRSVDLRDKFGNEALIGTGIRSKILTWSFNDSLRLTCAEWSLTIPDLPPLLDGLTILHLTDLHFSSAYGRRFFEEAISEAIADGSEPDIVAITGDFIDDNSCNAWIAPILGRLQSRLGKFAILGNHDYRQDFRTLGSELETAGFEILEGSWTTLDIEGCRLAIGGTSAPWGKDISNQPVPSAAARLLLSHAPDQVYRADRLGVDLMLCGHNHGGQVRLPIFGPVLMPSLYSRRFDRGFFRVGKVLLFVGQGLGAKDPVRIGCHPEIVRLTLRCPARSRTSAEVLGDESLVSATES
jgi:predicted MPP superfamily phosphohydrolase